MKLLGEIKKTTVSPELELLLNGVVAPISTKHLDSCDINLLWSLASYHRILPNLAFFVKKDEESSIIGRELASFMNAHTLHIMTYLQTTAQIFHMFDLAGIPVVMVKGPLLGMEIYGNPVYRQMSDLDLFVAESDLFSAVQMFEREGYKCKGNFSNSRRKWEWMLALEHHVVMTKGSSKVELHWKEYDGIDKVWDIYYPRISRKMMNTNLHTVDLDDQMIYLIYHASKHQYFRLKWLVDIALLMKQEKIDWQKVQDAYSEKGLLSIFLECLIVVYKLWPDEVPAIGTNELLIQKSDSKQSWSFYLKKEDHESFTENFVKATNLSNNVISEITKETLYDGEILGLAEKESVLLNGKKQRYRSFWYKFHPQIIDFEHFDFPDRLYFMCFLTRPVYRLNRFLERVKYRRNET